MIFTFASVLGALEQEVTRQSATATLDRTSVRRWVPCRRSAWPRSPAWCCWRPSSPRRPAGRWSTARCPCCLLHARLGGQLRGAHPGARRAARCARAEGLLGRCWWARRSRASCSSVSSWSPASTQQWSGRSLATVVGSLVWVGALRQARPLRRLDGRTRSVARRGRDGDGARGRQRALCARPDRVPGRGRRDPGQVADLAVLIAVITLSRAPLALMAPVQALTDPHRRPVEPQRRHPAPDPCAGATSPAAARSWPSPAALVGYADRALGHRAGAGCRLPPDRRRRAALVAAATCVMAGAPPAGRGPGGAPAVLARSRPAGPRRSRPRPLLMLAAPWSAEAPWRWAASRSPRSRRSWPPPIAVRSSVTQRARARSWPGTAIGVSRIRVPPMPERPDPAHPRGRPRAQRGRVRRRTCAESGQSCPRRTSSSSTTVRRTAPRVALGAGRWWPRCRSTSASVAPCAPDSASPSEGYDAVVQIDADGQHDPPSSCVLGAGETPTWSSGRGSRERGLRRAGPSVLGDEGPARRCRRSWGHRLTDVTSGFRAANRAVPVFARHYPAEYLGDTVESLVIAHKSGLRVSQDPVAMRPREHGTPSQRVLGSVTYLGRAAFALALALVRSGPCRRRAHEHDQLRGRRPERRLRARCRRGAAPQASSAGQVRRALPRPRLHGPARRSCRHCWGGLPRCWASKCRRTCSSSARSSSCSC